MCIVFRKSLLLSNSLQGCTSNIVRWISERRKFYKEARICHSDGGFEVNLDSRKLRSPSGVVLKLPNEGLAHAVATEWNMQKDIVKVDRMPLTALCYAATDNVRRKKESFIKASLKYLSTDTILCHMTEPPDLANVQEDKWLPLIKWLHTQYPVSVKPAVGFEIPTITPDSYLVLTKHLDSYNYWSIIGFETMTGVLKSVILSLAILERHLGIEEAVSLSRLEQEYQISKWGNVVWYHDMELFDLRMKTAACATFIHLCAEETEHSVVNLKGQFEVQ